MDVELGVRWILSDDVLNLKLFKGLVIYDWGYVEIIGCEFLYV